MKVRLNLLGIGREGFWSFIERFQLRPAMGLLLLTSVTRKAGHQVDFSDQRVERFSLDQWIERVVAEKYDVVGMSTYSTTRLNHAMYIRELRKRFEGKIVVGGPAAIAPSADFWLDNGADIAVIGEGERTFLEILAKCESGESCLGIPGTATRDANKQTVFGPPRPYLTPPEIEELPFPAWTPDWIRAYTDYTILDVRLPTAGVITARGCPYHCAFCGSPHMWGKVRQRSVANVMAEIDYLVRDFQIRHIGFLDDIFGIEPNWALEFC